MSDDGSKWTRGWSLIDLKALKFGPGIVGRITTMVAITVLALAGIAYGISDLYLGYVTVAFIFLLSAFAILKIFAFANRYPELATLENSQVVKYKEIQLAVKGEQLPLPAPNTESPPTIEHKESDNGG
jgi:hypothetical protein